MCKPLGDLKIEHIFRWPQGQRVFFFPRGKSGDGGTETDQGGRLLSGEKGQEWEDRHGPTGRHLLGYAGRGVVEGRD